MKNFDRKSYMKEYMKNKRKEEKLESLKDKNVLLNYCFPYLDTETYSDEYKSREINYLDKLIEKCREKEEVIKDNIKKYCDIVIEEFDDLFIYNLIRNGHARLSSSKTLELVNIHKYKK